MTDTALTALVSSRICHDLISPIGAISNGVELMTEIGGASSPELNLIGDSVQAAATKLRYFRIAFGAAPDDALIRTDDLRDAMSTMFGERFSVTFAPAEAEVTRIAAKALFLALLCLERALPLGGEIKADIIGSTVDLSADAKRVNADPRLWGLFDGANDDLDPAPAEVQFIILADLIAQRGARLVHDIGDAQVTFTLSGL